ncbi:MAG: alpha/beta hydrolase [Methanobacteriaceae archaeon]|jgi:pimeloyl-ACP methyl ester carboxylesterase|nr:alpha/beta hydrolase [Methanobacteriaceae archaeon]
MEELNFLEENTLKKKAIIFLHPKNLANWIWSKQLNVFKNYHTIFLDLPNHGKNKNNSKFTVKETVETLKDFILNLKKEEVNLVGIGLGGQIAISLISKYPNLINKTIISGVDVSLKEDKTSYENSIVQVLSDTKEILDNKKEGFLTFAYLRHFGIKKDYYDDLFNTFKNQDYENLKRISFESLNYSLDFNPKNNSKEILLCFGSYDTIWCKSSAHDIKKLYPNTHIMKIDNAVHLWNIRNSKKFNNIILDYLKSHNKSSLKN